MDQPLTAAILLDRYLEGWLDDILENNKGHEQEALIELVRSVDLHAYFQHFFDPADLGPALRQQCLFIEKGVGPILHAFLPKLDQFGDGIPWLPSNGKTAAWADRTLSEAGQLAMLRRLAHCEHYGLVRCEIHSEAHVSIHILVKDQEAEDARDHAWLISRQLDHRAEYQARLNQQMQGWARDRIDQYVSIHMDHFIQYDSDRDLHKLYQDQAYSSLIISPEADALPDESIIGPRTFGEWKMLTITAVARAKLHLSFATRLGATHRDKLNLRNLFTVPVRYEDLQAVWSQQTGITDTEGLDEIADIFLLTPRHAKEYYSSYDSPLPYNIGFGRYFALLPQFGYIGNTCTFLVTELKRKYRKDWDKAVNQREAKFQQDLYALLPEPRYIRGRENVTLRSSNGSTATDIDAVLLDTTANCLYLFQLKWFDIFGLGLKERQSKLTNLLKANKWVDQVSSWVSTLSQRELFIRLGLHKHLPSTTVEVQLFVLTRNSARFSGPHKYDERAAWIAWPRLVRLVAESSDHPAPLEGAWLTAKEDIHQKYQPSGEYTEYKFPDLQVDVHE